MKSTRSVTREQTQTIIQEIAATVEERMRQLSRRYPFPYCKMAPVSSARTSSVFFAGAFPAGWTRSKAGQKEISLYHSISWYRIRVSTASRVFRYRVHRIRLQIVFAVDFFAIPALQLLVAIYEVPPAIFAIHHP